MASFDSLFDAPLVLVGPGIVRYGLAVALIAVSVWQTYSRRLRLDSVATSLPGVLWLVIGLGALMSLSGSFFQVEDGRLHAILVAMLAAFIGLVVFMIFALDRPYRGGLGLRAGAYRLVYDQLMKP